MGLYRVWSDGIRWWWGLVVVSGDGGWWWWEGYHPFCTSTSHVKVQKEEEILTLPMAYSKAILTPSQVESQVIKIYDVTGLNLDIHLFYLPILGFF